MAERIGYTPSAPAPGVDAFTPEDDVARLVRTLHESGTLRALNGLFARFADVSAIALEHLDTEEGRNGVANALILLRGLGRIDSDGTDRFVRALTEGLDAAGKRLDEEKPPGAFGLLRALREPDVRRGLDAVLTLVGTMGARLNEDEDA